MLILASALVSYFLKPAQSTFTIADSKDELSLLEIPNSSDASFAKRVMTSNLAIVLMRSDFSCQNSVALGALRDWSKQQFSKDPEFLHPVSVSNDQTIHNNVFSAFMHNLIGVQYFWLERELAELIHLRVSEFQKSDSYQLFRIDFYELFGVDADAALLLSRYQDDRARLGVSVATTAASLLFLLFAGVLLRQSKRFKYVRKQRFCLAYGWLVTASLYLSSACTSNQVSDLVSCLFCGLIGFYLAVPFKVSHSNEGGIHLSRIELSSSDLAVIAWGSLTMVLIQVLTWIRAGSFINPDPITLLVSSITGDFLHDPAELKGLLVDLIGIFWLVLAGRTLYVYRRGSARAADLEAELKTLDHASIT
ncbi:MAG: hypothetical protein K2X97_08025 [Mycobacteriaceae bacterium]|nr:hypothetical protein [Mycobacteriaceae bacterium]